MPTSPPSYTSAPPAPDPGNAGTFDALAYAFTQWQKNNEGPEMAALAANAYNNAVEAAASAVSAAASQTAADASQAAAAATANVTGWVAGTYTAGAAVWSPVNYLTYRRKTTGSSSTDPSADAANWALLTGISANTTITTPILVGTREVRVAMAANNIDLSAGNVFTKTISGATALTVSNVPASGYSSSFVLVLTNGGSAAVTWFSGVKWAGGAAPTLTTSGRDRVFFMTEDGGTTWDATIAKAFA